MGAPLFKRATHKILQSTIYFHSPSPHAFRLRLIFFLTIAQVFVVRKDSGQRFTIRWNISNGTVKIISSVLRNFRSEGSQPPKTALSLPWSRYRKGQVTILEQPAPNGKYTASKSLVTNVASWFRPEITYALVKNITNSGGVFFLN